MGNTTSVKKEELNNFEKGKQIIDQSAAIGGLSIELNNMQLSFKDLEKLIQIIKEKKPRVEKLFLGNNNLKSLPNSLGELSSLNLLYICGNGIENLPEDIINNIKLKDVYLYDNPLSLETLQKISDAKNSAERFHLDENQKAQLDQLLSSKQNQNHGNETDFEKLTKTQNAQKSTQKSVPNKVRRTNGAKKKGALGVMP